MLTTLAVIIHARLWFGPAHPGGVIEPVGNVLFMAAFPGWVAATLLEGWKARHELGWTVFAYGVSFAGWILLFAIVWRIRGALAHPTRTKDDHPTDPRRRKLLVNGAFGGVMVCGGGAAAAPVVVNPYDLRVTRYRVAIKNLPRGFDGFRFAIVADTHLGSRVPGWHVQQAVRAAIDLNPDAILLLGDHIQDGTDRIDEAAQLIRPLVDTGKPVLGVLGNHDWYGDGVLMARALRSVGVTMIGNTRRFLMPGGTLLPEHFDGAICIAGVGDLETDSVEPDRAFRGVPSNTSRILLAHNPDTAETPTFHSADSPRVDLMLSGHTHGGQVRLPFIGAPIVPSRYGQKYAEGLVQGPKFPVLISRGIGVSGLPIRIGVPPEVIELTITSV